MDLEPHLLPGERALWTRSAWCGWWSFLRGHSLLWVGGLGLLVLSELGPAVVARLRGEEPPWTLAWPHVAAGLVLVAVALEVVPRVLAQRRTLLVVTSGRVGVLEPGRAVWLRDPPAPEVTALPAGRARCAWSRGPVELREAGAPPREEQRALAFVVPAEELPGLRAALLGR